MEHLTALSCRGEHPPRGFDKINLEGKKVLANLLDIPVPVVAALNGLSTVRPEGQCWLGLFRAANDL
jgi:hypothetical protein